MPQPDRPADANGRTFSRRITLGLVVGAVLGLLIGERAAVLAPIADIYIKLLQMTVLPYVTVSIIGGLGALSWEHAGLLVRRLGLVLLLLWGLALALVLLFPLMFPAHQSASFFSASLLSERETFAFVDLYIPTNPFYSLANNIVPAVVLFSLMVGAGLIAVPGKERLLDVLSVAAKAVATATNYVVALTPIGVFAICAVTAGTLSLDDLSRLRVYLVGYVAMSLFLSLWVLPGLVAALTPVPYRALLSRNRDALVMAFMTTSLFAVLPILTEQVKALVREYGGSKAAGAEADVIVPASFNFPHTGKVLSLSFVLFAGWFVDVSVPIEQYPRLAVTGVLAMFGNVNAAIPFLLDLLRIPSDTFRLFVTSGVINARFGSLLAAVHTLTVAVLATCSIAGLLIFDGRKLARFAGITLTLLILLVGGVRLWLVQTTPDGYTKDLTLTTMEPLRPRAPATIYAGPAEAAPLPPVVTSVLDRVRDRGRLRVGYVKDSLPYAFSNARGELVGFDIEMAHQLARDLGVGLELVLLNRSVLDDGLDPALCDVVMSGLVVTTDRAGHVAYSTPYLDETFAFIVRDHLAASFSDWSNVRAMGRIRLGMPNLPYYARKASDELPDAVIVPVEGMEDMFSAAAPPVDAFVATAERGSAYTLLHPEYSVAVPKPRPFKVPLAYIVAGRDAAMLSMIDSWVELKRKDGTIDALFGHWILGADSSVKAPRWSVLRDVLHWIP